jgi:hypothetical protein
MSSEEAEFKTEEEQLLETALYQKNEVKLEYDHQF